MSVNTHSQEGPDDGRRAFLSTATSLLMAGGLAAGYGTFAMLAAKYLYPTEGSSANGWLFVRELTRINKGDSFVFRSPAGASIVVARNGEAGTDKAQVDSDDVVEGVEQLLP